VEVGGSRQVSFAGSLSATTWIVVPWSDKTSQEGLLSRDAWVQPIRIVPKPWGHEEIFALVEGRFCGKVLHISAGHALSLQYHEKKEEVIAIQSGTALLDIGSDPHDIETIEIGANDSVHVRPGVLHRLTAVSDVVALEASTTELMDVVRLEDHYGREGTNAP
jgi:mannose-6-phosphate isomerase-like protein (cupin superfamily)